MIRKDEWNKKGPDLKAAAGCRSLAAFAVVGVFAGPPALTAAAAAAVRWLA